MVRVYNRTSNVAYRNKIISKYLEYQKLSIVESSRQSVAPGTGNANFFFLRIVSEYLIKYSTFRRGVSVKSTPKR